VSRPECYPVCGFRWQEAGAGGGMVWLTCARESGHLVGAHEPDPDAPVEPVAVKVAVGAIGVGDTVKVPDRAHRYLVVDIEHALRLSRDRSKPSVGLRRLTLRPTTHGRAIVRTFPIDHEITRVAAAFEVIAEVTV
jgi:hypothetical protein